MPASDWVSVAEASIITHLQLTTEELDAAWDEVCDAMRWIPDPTLDFLDDDPTNQQVLRARSVLKRATAWQAAYRSKLPPADNLQAKKMISRSIGSYSESFDASGASAAPAVVAPRVSQMLASAGLMRRAGWAAHGDVNDVDALDDDTFIPTT